MRDPLSVNKVLCRNPPPRCLIRVHSAPFSLFYLGAASLSLIYEKWFPESTARGPWPASWGVLLVLYPGFILTLYRGILWNSVDNQSMRKIGLRGVVRPAMRSLRSQRRDVGVRARAISCFCSLSWGEGRPLR